MFLFLFLFSSLEEKTTSPSCRLSLHALHTNSAKRWRGILGEIGRCQLHVPQVVCGYEACLFSGCSLFSSSPFCTSPPSCPSPCRLKSVLTLHETRDTCRLYPRASLRPRSFSYCVMALRIAVLSVCGAGVVELMSKLHTNSAKRWRGILGEIGRP